MAQRLQNPFQAQTPIGASIAQLGEAIFGGASSPGERQKQALETQFFRSKIDNLDEKTRQLGIQDATRAGITQALERVQLSSVPTVAPRLEPGASGPAQQGDISRQRELLDFNQAETARTTDFENSLQRAQRLGVRLAKSPQDVNQGIRGLLAVTPGVSDELLGRSVVGSGQLIGENQAVSLADRERVRAANAVNAGATEKFDRVNLLDTDTGAFVGTARLSKTSGQVFSDSGEAMNLPENVVVAGKPTVQAASASGLPGSDKTELRKVRDDTFAARTGASQVLGIVGELGALSLDPNAPLALGNIGKATAFISGIRAQAQAAFQQKGIVIETTLDPANFQSDLQRLGAQSAIAQSAIIDLAFAIATAREGGRLTDQDITRALQTMGANQNDPAIFRATLNRVAERVIRDEKITRRSMRERFASRQGQIPDILALQDLVNPLKGGGATAPAAAEQGGAAPASRIRFDASGQRVQ